MKKKPFFALCLLAMFLTSCDPGYIIEYKFYNQSGHRVTFTSNNTSNQYFWDKHPNGITLEQGNDSVFFVYDGLGGADLDLAKYVLLQYVFGDTISFSFDDGKQLVYSQETVTGPHDFDGDRFAWATEQASWPFHHDAYGCLSYTITEDDYLQAELP